MRLLVRSAEPAVVFSSLAHLCVPAFSDVCTIDIVEHSQIAYRIARYRSGIAPADTALGAVSDWRWSVSVPFEFTAPTCGDASGVVGGGYAGVMTHRWRSRRPTAAEKARATVLTRHAMATVARQRRLDDADRSRDAAEYPHDTAAIPGVTGYGDK